MQTNKELISGINANLTPARAFSDNALIQNNKRLGNGIISHSMPRRTKQRKKQIIVTISLNPSDLAAISNGIRILPKLIVTLKYRSKFNEQGSSQPRDNNLKVKKNRKRENFKRSISNSDYERKAKRLNRCITESEWEHLTSFRHGKALPDFNTERNKDQQVGNTNEYKKAIINISQQTRVTITDQNAVQASNNFNFTSRFSASVQQDQVGSTLKNIFLNGYTDALNADETAIEADVIDLTNNDDWKGNFVASCNSFSPAKER